MASSFKHGEKAMMSFASWYRIQMPPGWGWPVTVQFNWKYWKSYRSIRMDSSQPMHHVWKLRKK